VRFIFSPSFLSRLSRLFRHAQKATLAIRAKRQQVALSHLKLRKQLEGLLVKRLSSLETLEDTLVRVDAAAGDIAVRRLALLKNHPLSNIIYKLDTEILQIVRDDTPNDSITPVATA
jgi:hypothetical protein